MCNLFDHKSEQIVDFKESRILGAFSHSKLLQMTCISFASLLFPL